MNKIITVLQSGGVVVMPTDTIYGIVASATNREAVEKVYKIRKRAPEKPCIILISDEADLEKFKIKLNLQQKNILAGYWPGPVSIILDCYDEELAYLHRGLKTLAVRLPSDEKLREMIRKTGPLIAPSANPEGLPPAQNISEAKKYFGGEVDLYVEGKVNNKASKIIRLHESGEVNIIRE